MILAACVAIAGLALVVTLLSVERPPAVPGDAIAGHDDPERAQPAPPGAVDQLVAARLPRALVGYEPVAVRRALAVLATAYTELARDVDDDTVRNAWARAQHGPAPDAGHHGRSEVGTVGADGVDTQGDAASATTAAEGRTGRSGTAQDEGANRDG